VQVLAGVRRPHARVLLSVGDARSGPRSRGWCAELGPRAGRVLPRPAARLVSLLQQSDVFLFRARPRGSASAALEALACGVPVVRRPVGGVPEVVTDGETRDLCPLGDVAGMTAAVVSLLAEPERRRRIGRGRAAARGCGTSTGAGAGALTKALYPASARN